jgi:hypothetical protein
VLRDETARLVGVGEADVLAEAVRGPVARLDLLAGRQRIDAQESAVAAFQEIASLRLEADAAALAAAQDAGRADSEGCLPGERC